MGHVRVYWIYSDGSYINVNGNCLCVCLESFSYFITLNPLVLTFSGRELVFKVRYEYHWGYMRTFQAVLEHSESKEVIFCIFHRQVLLKVDLLENRVGSVFMLTFLSELDFYSWCIRSLLIFCIYFITDHFIEFTDYL